MHELRLLRAASAAMLRKYLMVAFRYPVNITCRVLGVATTVPAYLLAMACFLPGGVSGLMTTQAGQVLVGVVVYGFVIFQFTSDALWMLGFYLRQEQVEGTLEALYTTQANTLVYLLTRLVEPVALSSLNALVAVGIGVGVFGLPLPERWGLAAYALLMTVSGIFGLSMATAALSLRYLESAQALAGGAQLVLMTCCAMIYPFGALPSAIRALAEVIPLSYGVDLFRSTLLGFPNGYPELADVRTEVLVVGAWGLCMPIAGTFVYRWAEQRARVLGLLSRF